MLKINERKLQGTDYAKAERIGGSRVFIFSNIFDFSKRTDFKISLFFRK